MLEFPGMPTGHHSAYNEQIPFAGPYGFSMSKHGVLTGGMEVILTLHHEYARAQECNGSPGWINTTYKYFDGRVLTVGIWMPLQ